MVDFRPSEEDRQEKEKNAGFNTELPDPRGAGIEADEENDPFSDMMEEFADFEGTEDDGFGDDF